MIKKIFWLQLLGLLMVSCGQISTSQTSSFKLRMLGVYKEPAGASGTQAPRSQTYLFKSLKITKSDGTVVDLYTDEAKTFKVVDRAQLLYANYDMSAYDGLTFSNASVEVDPSIVVSTKTNQETTLTLNSGTLALTENFTISKSQSQVMTIKVSWAKTVTEVEDGTDTVTAPTFDIVYDAE
jgi:hypothetical protein